MTKENCIKYWFAVFAIRIYSVKGSVNSFVDIDNIIMSVHISMLIYGSTGQHTKAIFQSFFVTRCTSVSVTYTALIEEHVESISWDMQCAPWNSERSELFINKCVLRASRFFILFRQIDEKNSFCQRMNWFFAAGCLIDPEIKTDSPYVFWDHLQEIMMYGIQITKNRCQDAEQHPIALIYRPQWCCDVVV